MQQDIFSSAEILLPDFEKINAYQWSVIACDQFTSEPSYWKETTEIVENAPSVLNLILPEIYLETPDVESRITKIHEQMQDYFKQDIFKNYTNAMIYVERVQSDGKLRTGVIGKIDLECYDYHADSQSPVRATEATVLERIPPRMRVRDKAILELPHIMLLIDDSNNIAIGTCTAQKNQMQKLYDTELMQNGGHVTGYLMNAEQQINFQENLQKLFSGTGALKFAMGDGNHSLATAKACYEALKNSNPDVDFSNHPARYALVELVNLHSDALEFEAIHRIVMQTDTEKLLAYLTENLALSQEPAEQFMIIIKNNLEQKLYIHKPSSSLTVGSLQNALDNYLAENSGKIDYIHGIASLKKLSQQANSIGFLLPDMDKKLLFSSVEQDGALPRKTFSMGHAQDKRYYIEARKIK
ncbi:MAG: DUF1015 domain-containing protein [Oscillospiraceae bacterium]|nr:DUF1015 domain-containing protein [Oscillospiraceae bacterium]